MKTGRLYLQTFLELFIFIVIGFFFTQYVLRFAYERAGIAYNGNIGVVCLGAAFLLLCTYTILRIAIVKKPTPLLAARMRSLTFWLVYIFGIYSVLSPFARGAIS
ncbi:hypothetical protein [Priestia koreensis]|uniref:hypothetical protein n=1 Tax=Priestia koreensis TaxID=284581 RepID=UPI001F5A8589|nr:hypothetical protein [Priestia koreensis]UNL83239.1 hypothetical protein IE339_13750 [Priestia koreensis]